MRAIDATGIEAIARAFTRFTREPSAGDVRPGAIPLTIRRSGPTLRLTWEDLATEANVYQGTIASLRWDRAYDHHDSGGCGVAGGVLEIDSPDRDSYFLVGGRCEWGDGTLGRDSFGRAIPRAFPGCP